MQTSVRVDKLKDRESVDAGAFEGTAVRDIDATEDLEAWLNVFDVGGAGTVTVNVRTSYLENPDISDPLDWHIIGTFAAVAAVGIPTPLAFTRGDTPLGQRVSVIGSVAANAVEFEVVMVAKEPSN